MLNNTFDTRFRYFKKIIYEVFVLNIIIIILIIIVIIGYIKCNLFRSFVGYRILNIIGKYINIMEKVVAIISDE